MAEWCYNTTTHSATGKTPFEITYGCPPLFIPHYLAGTTTVEAVDNLLSSRTDMLTKLRKKLLGVQQKMKVSTDSHRRDVTSSVGDWVYVRLRLYRQLSAANTTYNKLGKRYYRPFQITAKIGPVAYHLALPDSSRIHPVFHCSLLKPHHGPPSPPTPLPPIIQDEKPLVTPLTILDSKWDPSITPPRRLALVQWPGLPPEDTTWEDWDSLQDTFHLEDKMLFEGDGNDSNSAPTITDTAGSSNSKGSKPKRNVSRPQGWNNYVH